jgi:hypothetical protein
MPRKTNLPNLARWDINFEAGKHVKHAGCGGRIVGETRPHQAGRVKLKCGKCGQWLGRLATTTVKDRAVVDISPMIGLGRQLHHRLYFCLPKRVPGEGEDEV